MKYLDMTPAELEREIQAVRRTLERAKDGKMARGAKACRQYMQILRLRQVQLRLSPTE